MGIWRCFCNRKKDVRLNQLKKNLKFKHTATRCDAIRNATISEQPSGVERFVKTGPLKIIEPSINDCVSPVLLVSNVNGGVRYVTDFQKVNKYNIVPESATFVRIDCSIESIGSSGSKLYSTLELAQGYWMIPV